MDNYTTIEEHGYTTTGMVGVPQYTMSDIYRFTPKEQAEYPTLLKRQWHSDCTKARDEVMAWVLRYEFTHDTPLNRVAFENEITEQLKVLTNQDPGLKTEKFYYNGIIDYPKLGKYMGCLFPYPDKQRTASCVVEKIEFLITHRDKQEDTLPSDITTEQTPLLEDEETAMLRKFIENLKPHFKRGVTFYLLFTVRDICDNQLYKSYAKNVQQFAIKIAPILGMKATSLNSQICEAGKDLLIDGRRSYHSISTLTAKQINTVQALQHTELHKWKQCYELVKSLIPSEMLT